MNMGFKIGFRKITLAEKDLEGEVNEVRKLGQIEPTMVHGNNNLLPNDFLRPQSQQILPPIYPLLGVKKAVEKRKMADIELILQRIRCEGDEMFSVFTWKEINNQKGQLQELFTTAEKGIKENRASMARFYEIIKENFKHLIVLENEIKFTRERIGDYRQVEEEFSHYVYRYSIFEKFLESVAEVDGGWRNVRDVLNRYETLHSTSVECARILENELEQATELRKLMLRMVEVKSSTLKSLSNRLIQLEVHRKDARDRRIYWEHMMQRIKYTVLDKIQEAMSLKEGINDLYLGMCMKLKAVPNIPSSDAQGQVDFIHKNIMFHKEVVTIASGLKSPPVGKDKNKKPKPKTKKIK